MSGKYESKKKKPAARTPGRKSRKKRRSNAGLIIAIVIVLILLCAMALVFLALQEGEPMDPSRETTLATAPATQATQPEVKVEVPEEVSFDLGNDLMVTDLGAYTGVYMEDGSDELVSGVTMIVVTNNGDSTLQYAEITLTGESGDAFFSISTLNPGASAVVLEANRKAYSTEDSYTGASAEHVVFFQEPLNLYEDVFEIQTLDGGFNITNISDQDITGRIEIYYKNSSADMFYGGITYVGRIEGGMKAGEIKQIMSQHFSASGTTIMYINVVEQ